MVTAMEGQMPNDTIAMNGWVGGMQTSPLNFDYNIYSESMDSSSFMGDNLKKTPDAMKGIDPALYNNQWSAEVSLLPMSNFVFVLILTLSSSSRCRRTSTRCKSL